MFQKKARWFTQAEVGRSVSEPQFEETIHFFWNQKSRKIPTHFLIEQRRELPDDVTCKNGHCNVAIPPRHAAAGDPADRHAHQQ